MLLGATAAGESRLAAVARVGRLAPRGAPLGAAEHVQHFLWHLPGGHVWRCFNVYVPPSAGEAVSFAEARRCLVEAMWAPRVPTIVCGDLNAVLEGHPLEAAFHRQAGSPRWRGCPHPRRLLSRNGWIGCCLTRLRDAWPRRHGSVGASASPCTLGSGGVCRSWGRASCRTGSLPGRSRQPAPTRRAGLTATTAMTMSSALQRRAP